MFLPVLLHKGNVEAHEYSDTFGADLTKLKHNAFA